MEQALVRLGRFVNDMEAHHHGDNLHQAGQFLIDCRRNGSDYDRARCPSQQQYLRLAMRVRAAYLYSGMADVAAETKDVDTRARAFNLGRLGE